MPKKNIVIEEVGNEVLANLFGNHDEHLKLLAKNTNTIINARSNIVQIEGEQSQIDSAERLLDLMLNEAANGDLNLRMTHVITQAGGEFESNVEIEPQEVKIQTKKGVITGRSLNQKIYLQKFL